MWRIVENPANNAVMRYAGPFHTGDRVPAYRHIPYKKRDGSALPGCSSHGRLVATYSPVWSEILTGCMRYGISYAVGGGGFISQAGIPG